MGRDGPRGMTLFDAGSVYSRGGEISRHVGRPTGEPFLPAAHRSAFLCRVAAVALTMTGSHDDCRQLSLAMFVRPTEGDRGQT